MISVVIEEAVPAAAVVDEEVVEAVEEEVVVEAVVEMMMTIPHLRVKLVLPDVDDTSINSSTMPRGNNDWHNSCKINDRQQRDVVLQVSPPPTRSPPRTKTDNDLA